MENLFDWILGFLVGFCCAWLWFDSVVSKYRHENAILTADSNQLRREHERLKKAVGWYTEEVE